MRAVARVDAEGSSTDAWRRDVYCKAELGGEGLQRARDHVNGWGESGRWRAVPGSAASSEVEHK